MKKKNIKIKHRNYNLYNKKKSKGRQALGIILTIVIALALVVVGFGLGRPLMDYFNNKNNHGNTSSESAWTPPVTTATDEAKTAEAVTVESVEDTKETSENAEQQNRSVYILPASALSNAGALNSAVNTAKNSGYTGVMATLKNQNSSYFYKTELEGIKDSDLVAGTLTAKEIADTITNAGLTPIARISTLRDPLSGNYYAKDMKLRMSDGVGWLDGRVENGGKSWISAFSENTIAYISEITAEITSAGFKTIVYANTMHPFFREYDLRYFGHLPVTDNAKRTEALWNVISAGEKAADANGAKVLLEINAEDLDAEDKNATTAEITADMAKLRSHEIVIAFTPQSGSEYISAKSLAGKLNGAFSSVKSSVMVNSSGASDTAKAEYNKAFKEANVTVFSE